MEKALVLFILIPLTAVGMNPTLLTASTPLPLPVPTHKMLEFSAGLNVRRTLDEACVDDFILQPLPCSAVQQH